MLSRVADSMYWMGRYIERAENVARFVDVNHNMTLNASGAVGPQWQPLINITGDWPTFASRYGEATRESVLHFLTFDGDYPNSILSCLQSARENARCVRESISTAMWEEINKFHRAVRDAAAQPGLLDHPSDFYNGVKLASHLLEGITDATISHDESWHFVRLGRMLERADKTSRILDVKYFILLPGPEDVGSPIDIVQWSALLQSASALEMYRKSHGRISPTNVAEFLLLDSSFPRSVRFCLARAEHSLRAITGTSSGAFSTIAEQLLGRLRSEFDYTHVNDVVAMGMHEFIDRFQVRLNRIGDAIRNTFFEAPAVGARTYVQEQLQ